jgi:membrane protein
MGPPFSVGRSEFTFLALDGTRYHLPSGVDDVKSREYGAVLRSALRRCFQVNTDRMAAEIAFAALLSLAPLLLIGLSVASRLLGPSTARPAFLDAMGRTVGITAAELAAYMLDLVPDAPGSGWAAVVGLLLMVWFSSSVFRAVRGALNTIWDVPPPPGIRRALRHWTSSIVLVLVTVLLILIIIALSLAMSLIGPVIVDRFPQGALFLRTINFLIGFSLLSSAITILLMRGPQVRLRVGDVIGAALMTSSMYALANMIISHLIWKSMLASFYGAAGALVVIILWAYYGAHILLFGAAYCRALLEHQGRRIPFRWESGPSGGP